MNARLVVGEPGLVRHEGWGRTGRPHIERASGTPLAARTCEPREKRFSEKGGILEGYMLVDGCTRVYRSEKCTGRSGTEVSLASDPGPRIDMPGREGGPHLCGYVRFTGRYSINMTFSLPAVDPLLSLSFWISISLTCCGLSFLQLSIKGIRQGCDG